MPAEASAPAEAAARGRRIGLRVALAISVGLTFGVATGDLLPFLGPMFAAQFLLAGPRPLPLGKAIGMAGLVLVVGQVLVVLTGILGDRPPQFLALLGLFYFLCFVMHAQGKGGPAAFMCMVIAIMVPLLDLLHRGLDNSMVLTLLKGCVGGVVLSWLAHLVLPEPAGSGDTLPPPAIVPGSAVARAFASTIILLLAVTLCLTNSAFSSAIVVPITVASLLLQLDLTTSARGALALVAVNLLGGVIASLAFAFVELRPSPVFLFLITLLVGLILAGRAASPSPLSRMYGGAITTFLILFGTGLSPLPASTPESFSTRVGFVLFAIAYTICMASLLWPRNSATQAGHLPPGAGARA